MRSILTVFVILAVIITGCVSFDPVKFDNNLELEDSALVQFFWVYVYEYNGIQIPTKRETSGIRVSEWVYKALPPGEANFGVDVYGQSGNTIYRGRDFTFRYRFEPGVDYILLFAIKDGIWGINVYNQKPPKAGFPDSANLIEFVPFSNFQSRRVLE